jgi:hypothetical protein
MHGTASDLMANYASVRARLNTARPTPKPVVIPPSAKEEPPVEPLAVQRYLEPIGPKLPMGGPVTIKGIIQAVACEFLVAPVEIKGTSRVKHICFARQVAYLVARRMTALSLPQIGRRFRGEDHTTILHGIRKIEALAAADPAFAARISSVMDMARASR